MATQARRDDGPITAINVTPLVDVMLVLLAIFMLTERLADERSAVPLDLPSAASGEAIQRVLRIAIDADGERRVFGATRELSGDLDLAGDEGLRTLAARMRRAHPQLRTVIEASGRADHAHVIAVLDTLRLAGIHKIAFAVEPTKAPRESAP